MKTMIFLIISIIYSALAFSDSEPKCLSTCERECVEMYLIDGQNEDLFCRTNLIDGNKFKFEIENMSMINPEVVLIRASLKKNEKEVRREKIGLLTDFKKRAKNIIKIDHKDTFKSLSLIQEVKENSTKARDLISSTSEEKIAESFSKLGLTQNEQDNGDELLRNINVMERLIIKGKQLRKDTENNNENFNSLRREVISEVLIDRDYDLDGVIDSDDCAPYDKNISNSKTYYVLEEDRGCGVTPQIFCLAQDAATPDNFTDNLCEQKDFERSCVRTNDEGKRITKKHGDIFKKYRFEVPYFHHTSNFNSNYTRYQISYKCNDSKWERLNHNHKLDYKGLMYFTHQGVENILDKTEKTTIFEKEFDVSPRKILAIPNKNIVIYQKQLASKFNGIVIKRISDGKSINYSLENGKDIYEDKFHYLGQIGRHFLFLISGEDKIIAVDMRNKSISKSPKLNNFLPSHVAQLNSKEIYIENYHVKEIKTDNKLTVSFTKNQFFIPFSWRTKYLGSVENHLIYLNKATSELFAINISNNKKYKLEGMPKLNSGETIQHSSLHNRQYLVAAVTPKFGQIKMNYIYKLSLKKNKLRATPVNPVRLSDRIFVPLYKSNSVRSNRVLFSDNYVIFSFSNDTYKDYYSVSYDDLEDFMKYSLDNNRTETLKRIKLVSKDSIYLGKNKDTLFFKQKVSGTPGYVRTIKHKIAGINLNNGDYEQVIRYSDTDNVDRNNTNFKVEKIGNGIVFKNTFPNFDNSLFRQYRSKIGNLIILFTFD